MLRCGVSARVAFEAFLPFNSLVANKFSVP